MMDMLLIRQMLEQILGYNYPIYLRKLRQWFANMITKERFDDDIRPILQGEALKLHNQLVLGILFHSQEHAYVDSSNNSDEYYQQQQLYNPVLEQSSETVIDDDEEDDNDDESGSDEVVDSRCTFELELPLVSEENKPSIESIHRFPASFATPFQVAHDGDYDSKVNVIPNVTHSLRAVHQNVKENPALRKVFRLHRENQPILTSEASILGRFLVQAWKNNVDNVDPKVMKTMKKACVDHIKNIVIAIVKQRKAFRLQNGRYCHSIGAPYPNPYLLQGHHLFGDTYSSDTAKLADVMQIPSFLPTQDEKERLAALEVAASVQLRYAHLKTKATLADLLDAIQIDKSLIPNYMSRVKICEEIFQKSKGYGDAYRSYDDKKDLVAKTVYPIISY